MKIIWKFPLVNGDSQQIEMPQGAEILSVQQQGHQACLWAIVDDNAVLETRTIEVHGTGNPMPPIPRKYIGTFQQPPFVWHVFEIVKEHHDQ